MGYKIGSFNLRNLGLSALGNNNERDLKKISEIIKNEAFDVIAFQEVLSEGKAFTSPNYAKKSIMMELGNDWDFQWANAETQLADTRNEGYAFAWNKRKLRLATTKTSTGETRTFYPRICRLNKDYMQRLPYYARFTPADTIVGGPWIEFRLLCIHTFYGHDTKADRIIRQKELDVLLKDIYPQVSDRKYGEYGNGMPSYTVIMGDYNVELRRLREDRNGSYIEPAYIDDVVESTSWGNRKIKTDQDGYTTLRASLNDTNNIENGRYIHNYDHFSYEESQFKGVYMNVERVDAVKKYCDNDFDRYSKSVSDHIPILMKIDIRNNFFENN